MSGLGARVFAAYSRNSGNDPAEHFDRHAGEQWMQQALDEVGVSFMLEVLRQIHRMGYTDIGDRLMVEAAIAKATGAQP